MKLLAGLILGLLTACSSLPIAEERSRLDRIGGELQAVAEAQLWCQSPCAHIILSSSPDIKAWATVDTKIVVVTLGMVNYTRGDDELAFVLAHEIAHVALACSTCRPRAVIETMADALAVVLMTGAGYDPLHAIALLQRLGSEFEWMSDGSHPTFATRVEAIAGLIE